MQIRMLNSVRHMRMLSAARLQDVGTDARIRCLSSTAGAAQSRTRAPQYQKGQVHAVNYAQALHALLAESVDVVVLVGHGDFDVEHVEALAVRRCPLNVEQSR